MEVKNIVLIGMSGTGKSHWRPLLADELHLEGVCCDEEIEKRLGPFLKQVGYSGGIADVARWMGQPYDPRYPANSQHYLEFEVEVMQEFIAKRRMGQRLVIDTTGSIIHTGEYVLRSLGENSVVVLLDAPVRHQEELYQQYLSDPKPVVWGKSFKPLDGEGNTVALKRCYPSMLAHRRTLYKQIANVTLEWDEVRSEGFNAAKFLRRIGF